MSNLIKLLNKKKISTNLIVISMTLFLITMLLVIPKQDDIFVSVISMKDTDTFDTIVKSEDGRKLVQITSANKPKIVSSKSVVVPKTDLVSVKSILQKTNISPEVINLMVLIQTILIVILPKTTSISPNIVANIMTCVATLFFGSASTQIANYNNTTESVTSIALLEKGTMYINYKDNSTLKNVDVLPSGSVKVDIGKIVLELPRPPDTTDSSMLSLVNTTKALVTDFSNNSSTEIMNIYSLGEKYELFKDLSSLYYLRNIEDGSIIMLSSNVEVTNITVDSYVVDNNKALSVSVTNSSPILSDIQQILSNFLYWSFGLGLQMLKVGLFM